MSRDERLHPGAAGVKTQRQSDVDQLTRSRAIGQPRATALRMQLCKWEISVTQENKAGYTATQETNHDGAASGGICTTPESGGVLVFNKRL